MIFYQLKVQRISSLKTVIQAIFNEFDVTDRTPNQSSKFNGNFVLSFASFFKPKNLHLY
jgi:hypothetical protein